MPLARNAYMPTDAPMVAWHWPSDVVGMNSVRCDTGTGAGCITFNETSLVTRSKIYRRSYFASITYLLHAALKYQQLSSKMGPICEADVAILFVWGT